MNRLTTAAYLLSLLCACGDKDTDGTIATTDGGTTDGGTTDGGTTDGGTTDGGSTDGGTTDGGGEPEAPVCTFTEPADGAAYEPGEDIAFAGLCTDDHTEPTALSVALSSDLDGIVSAAVELDGEGAFSLTWSGASTGDHILELTAEDADGHASTVTLAVSVSVTTGGDGSDSELVFTELADADAILTAERDELCIGTDVEIAGDLNSDGFDDLLIGAYPVITGHKHQKGHCEDGSEAYVLFGPVEGEIGMDEVDITLTPDWVWSSLGRTLAAAGDVDGDGHDDILLGDSSVKFGGKAYLLLGPVTAGGEVGAVADVVIATSGASDSVGFTVDGAGDVNGDGLDDLLIGAPATDVGRSDGAGVMNLVLGPADDIEEVEESHARIMGTADLGSVGQHLDAGDLNGDGLSDLVIGAHTVSSTPLLMGAAFVLHGPVSGEISIADVEVGLWGEAEQDRAGETLCVVGDVDADGYNDLVVGADQESSAGNYAGAVYLVLGPVTTGGELSDADAKLTGFDEHDYAGYACDGAGDVDEDGFADFHVGAKRADGDDREDAGAVYLVTGPVWGTSSLGDATAAWIGDPSTDDYEPRAGHSLSGSGDVDGDGMRDLLIGAPSYGDGSPVAGRAYLVLDPGG